MNAALLFTIQGSIEEIEEKVGGDLNRVSEFLILQKYAERFEKVFIFSDDKKDCSHLLPDNCYHIRLYNSLIYIIVGWLVLLYYTLRYRIKVIHLVGSPALPMTFMVNKLTEAKVVLDYNYLWYKSYITDTGKGVKNRLRKNSIVAALVRQLEGFLVNNFVDYIMLGTKEAREIIKNEKKIMPIKKGIILKDFDSNKVKKHEIFSKIKGKSVLFVGRLAIIKDPLTIIKAYKIVKNQNKNLNLIICGDGELKEDCKKISDKDVYFMGYTKDIPAILKGSDIYILTSLYDASPRSLLEAMAMGKPCIATRVGGVEYYLEGCGILVEPGNPEMLAEKIIYLLENPEVAKELGKKARDKMLKEHDLEKNIEKELGIVMKKEVEIVYGT